MTIFDIEQKRWTQLFEGLNGMKQADLALNEVTDARLSSS
jgi:hypothetical protein